MNVAATVRGLKDAHPDLYCQEPQCLWQTGGRNGSACRNHPPAAAASTATTVASTTPATGETFHVERDDRARRIAGRLAESVRFGYDGRRPVEFRIDRDWPKSLLPWLVATQIEELAAEYADEELRHDPRDDPDCQRDRYDDPRDDQDHHSARMAGVA